MNTPSSFKNLLTSLASIFIISAIMFATITSALESTTSNNEPCLTTTLSDTLFISQFSFDTFTATSSKSPATTSFAPNCAAAIASIPLPQPISNTVFVSST